METGEGWFSVIMNGYLNLFVAYDVSLIISAVYITVSRYVCKSVLNLKMTSLFSGEI